MKQLFIAIITVLITTINLHAQCNTGCVSFNSGGNINTTADNQVLCITGGTNYNLTFNHANVRVRVCAPNVTLSSVQIQGTGTNAILESFAINTRLQNLVVGAATFNFITNESGASVDAVTLNRSVRFTVRENVDLTINANMNPGQPIYFDLGDNAVVNTRSITSNQGGEIVIGRDGTFNVTGNLFLQSNGYLFNTGSLNVTNDMTVQGGQNAMNNFCGESSVYVGGTFIINNGGITNNGAISANNITVNANGGPVFQKQGALIEARASLTAFNQPNLFRGDSINDGQCALFRIATFGSWNGALTNSNKINYCGPAVSAARLGSATVGCECTSSPELCYAICEAPTNVSITGLSAVCAGGSAVLTANATGLVSGDSYRYIWYRGAVTPANQVANNVDVNTLSVSQSGNYTVVISNLIDEELCFEQNTTAFQFTVNPLPTAPVITGLQSVCSGQTPVNYAIQSPNVGSTYQWTVPVGASIISGTGTSSISVNFNNAAAGARQISVRETSAAGCQAATVTTYPVTINSRPVTTSIQGLNNICANTSNVTYTAVPTNAGSTYQWTVPTGVTLVSGQGTSSITVDFGTSATRTISVRETNLNGCEATSAYSTQVVVNPLPSAPTLSGPSTVCANTSHNYSVTGTNTYTWTVTGATGSSTTGNEIVVNFSTTNANVSVLATNSNGCTSSTSTQRAVTVNPRPNTSVITSNFASVCEGTTNATFSVVNTPGSTYQWTTTKGAIVLGQTTNQITVNFANVTAGAGVVSVIETNSNTCTTQNPVTFNFEVFNRPSTSAIQGNALPLCEAQSIVYSVTNTPGSTYAWTVPTGASIASGIGTSSITVNFGDSNTPAISVVETNAANCVGQTLTFPITLQGCGLASIINANTTVCQGSAITFTDASTGAIDSWSWNFGAGASPASSTIRGPHNVTYSTPGTKTITLTVTSGLATSVSTFELTVFPSPTLTTTGINGLRTVCSFTNGINYTANGFSGSTYAWTVSGATLASSTGNQAVVNFGSTNATVRVVETTSNNCVSNAIEVPVTVNARPNSPTLTGPNTVCANTTHNYSVTGTNSYAWTVTGATGSSTSGNQIAVDFGTTNTTVSVLATNSNGCTSINPTVRNVTVNARPTTSPITSDFASVCEGTTNATFNVVNTPGSTYQWSTTRGVITSATTTNQITVNFDGISAGVGTVSLTETNSNTCTNLTPLTYNFEVFDRPNTSEITGNGQPLCEEENVVYSVTPTLGSSYVWDVPTGAVIVSGQGTPTISVNFATSNAPSIRVTETNAATCVGQTMLFPVVLQGCGLQAMIDANTSICQGSSITFSDASTGDVDSWSWNFGAGATPTIASTQGPHNITYSTAGTKTISLTVTSGLASSTTTFEVEVYPTPELNVNSIDGLRTICSFVNDVPYTAVGGLVGSTYSWSVQGATLASSNGGNAVVNYGSTNAIISLTETTANNCVSNTTSVPVTVNARPSAPIVNGPLVVCENTTHEYTITGNQTYTWTVTNATGSSTSGNQISVDFGSDNTTIEVIATNNNNCSSINPTVRNITVNARPTTSPIRSDFASVCEGTENATFEVDQTSGSTYDWQITKGVIVDGDGTNRITVDFSGISAGEGTVTLIETNSNECTNMDALTYAFEVFDRPDTDPIQGNGLPLCEAQGIVYSVSPTAGSTYQWTVPNGAVITNGQGTASITVTFGTSNTPAISVVETNAATCVGQVLTFPVVLQGCGLQAVINANNEICQGSTITFTDASTGSIDSWVWDFGLDANPASSTSSGPHDVVYSTPGDKVVTLTVTSGLAVSVATFNLTVNPTPTITSDDIIGLRELCAFTNGVAYEVNGFDGSTYAWSVDNAILVSTSANEAVINFLDQNALVRVVETTVDNCVSQVIEVPVIVNPLPEPVFIDGDISVCVNDITSYSVNNVEGYTYDWTITPNATITGQGSSEIQIEFPTDGTYELSLVTTSDKQCVIPDNQVANFTIVVHPLPERNEIEGPILVCENTTHTYTVLGNPNSTYQWIASFTDATVIPSESTTSAQITFGSASGGAIIAVETSIFGCTTLLPAVLEMRVRQVPSSPSIVAESYCITTAGDTLLNEVNFATTQYCENQPAVFSVRREEGVTYTWSPNNIIYEGNTTERIKIRIPDEPFTLRLIETDASGCDSRPAEIQINPQPYIDATSIVRMPSSSIFENEISLGGMKDENGAWKVCDSTDTRNVWNFTTDITRGAAVYDWSLAPNSLTSLITPIDTIITIVNGDTVITIVNSSVNVKFADQGAFDLNLTMSNLYCRCDEVNLNTALRVYESVDIDYTIANPFKCITDSLNYELMSSIPVAVADTVDVYWAYSTLKNRDDLIRFSNPSALGVNDNAAFERINKYQYHTQSNNQTGVVGNFYIEDIYHFDTLSYRVNPRFCVNMDSSRLGDAIRLNAIDLPHAAITAIVDNIEYYETVTVDYDVNITNQNLTLTETFDRNGYIYAPNRAITYAWHWVYDDDSVSTYQILESPFDKEVKPKVQRRELMEYYVVTDNGYCKDSTYITVNVDYIPWIPNAFTPNNDGTFNTWEIMNIDRFPNAQIRIWNRWGSLVYDPGKGVIKGWDGTRNGDNLPAGTYFYIVDYGVDGIEPEAGDVSIVK